MSGVENASDVVK